MRNDVLHEHISKNFLLDIDGAKVRKEDVDCRDRNTGSIEVIGHFRYFFIDLHIPVEMSNCKDKQ